MNQVLSSISQNPHDFNYDRLNVFFRAFKVAFDSERTANVLPIFAQSLKPFLEGSELTRLAVDPLCGTLIVDGFIWRWGLTYCPAFRVLRLALPNKGFFQDLLNHSNESTISQNPYDEWNRQVENWVPMTEEQIKFFPEILSFIDEMYTQFVHEGITEVCVF
jgi:hypothetical protein